MSKPITAVLIGAGSRGEGVYGRYALVHRDEIKFVAVAEPNPVRRERFANAHNIPSNYRFESWRDALEQGKIADAVVNSTPDQMHAESGIAAMEAGYDMLHEKPIAHTLEDSIRIVQVAEEQDRYLQICHVLRYTDFFRKIYEILQSGRLGQIITISHRENVSSWHMAHSYVRGNWRMEQLSSPMILAKCCHDLDLINWFVGKPAMRLNSFGSLKHFRPENAPPGAPGRCTDGCPVESSCPYYAPAIYIDLSQFKHALAQSRNPLHRMIGNLSLIYYGLIKSLAKLIPPMREFTEYKGWPRSTICDNPGNEVALLEALQSGPYGRCVYQCDNDVVDHQVVAIEYEGGITATLNMHGHSHEEGRTLRIDGAKASLLGKFSFNRTYLDIHNHRSMQVEHIEFPSNLEKPGHGGGDYGVISEFVSTINKDRQPKTSARESLESHLIAFAAEASRHAQQVIDMQDFRDEAEKKVYSHPL
jgi:predicted dehydrogenase